VQQEQRSVSASRIDALRSRVRGWFTSTGAPPAWGLVRYLVSGLFVGAALSSLLPDFRATLLAALTGAVVAASGSGGPSGISRRVAVIGAALALVLTVVAFATGNDPVWAAIAMAAVALLTSVAAAAGPLGALLSDRRRRPHLGRLDPARGRADRRRHRLGREPAPRHDPGLCDRSGRHLPALAERQREQRDRPGAGDVAVTASQVVLVGPSS
jgi:hypothetical protein